MIDDDSVSLVPEAGTQEVEGLDVVELKVLSTEGLQGGAGGQGGRGAGRGGGQWGGGGRGERELHVSAVNSYRKI